MISMFYLVPVSLAIWTGLYTLLIMLWPKEKYELHCRIVTLLHAVLIVAMSGWSVFIQGPWPYTDPAGPNTVLHEYTCAISFGYFIFDFLWCIYFQTEGPVMLFHHILSMFGDTIILLRGINGCEMMAALFGTELTNPLLQTRWFIRHTSLVVPVSFKEAVDIAFLLLFTIMRIGIASTLLYSYLLHPRPDVIARGGAIAIYVIGWIFWAYLIRYAWRKYVIRKPPPATPKDHQSPSNQKNSVTNDHYSEGDAVSRAHGDGTATVPRFGSGEAYKRSHQHKHE